MILTIGTLFDFTLLYIVELSEQRVYRKTPNYIHCKMAHFRDTIGNKMAYFRQNPFVMNSAVETEPIVEPEPLPLDEDDDLSLDQATSRWVDMELKWRNEAARQKQKSAKKFVLKRPNIAPINQKLKKSVAFAKQLLQKLFKGLIRVMPNLAKLFGLLMFAYGVFLGLSNIKLPDLAKLIPANEKPEIPSTQVNEFDAKFDDLKRYTLFLEERLNALTNYTKLQETSLLAKIAELEKRDCDSELKADKTGMADYALESSGGEIVPEWTSRGLMTSYPLLKVWDVPLFYQTLSPRLAIQPQVNPGNCFGYNGNEGSIGIKLSRDILVSAVTIEHIPKVNLV